MDETLGEAAGPDERKEVEEMMNRVEAETTPPSHGKPSIFYRVVPSFTECDFGFFYTACSNFLLRKPIFHNCLVCRVWMLFEAKF